MINYKDIKFMLLHPIKMWWYELQMYYGGAWNFFCKQQHKLEDRMIHSHYQNTDNKHVGDEIIYMCNGFMYHGGLADRIKGMVSVYDWCIKNQRDFRINFVEPFILQNYIVPNTYNWIPDEISYDKSKAMPKICMKEPRTYNKREIKENWNSLALSWLNNNLSTTKRQLHIYTNMRRDDVDFGVCFTQLFKPCLRLQKEIDYHLRKIGDIYISISFRFTKLLGDFTDCTGDILPKDKQESLIEKSLIVISEISKIAPPHEKILVTADSEKFLSRAKCISGVYVIPGKIGHIDYDSGDAINMKTFLDFFLISNATAVFLAKGPEMYRSVFAETASKINNKPFAVYEY